MGCMILRKCVILEVLFVCVANNCLQKHNCLYCAYTLTIFRGEVTANFVQYKILKTGKDWFIIENNSNWI